MKLGIETEFTFASHLA